MTFTLFRQITAGILFVLFSSQIQAQNNDQMLPCGTYKALHEFRGNDPDYYRNRKELEDFTDSFSDENASREAAKIIPVVVHIIHNYGAENISDSQVADAIRIINEDFRKLNPDASQVISSFSAIAADAGFEFRLARKDPSGKCTNGITRTVSSLTFNADDNVKSLISWPTDSYLNIWVVSNISFGAGGYSYFPGISIASGLDGVVVVNRQFASIGTSAGNNYAARTLTHEIGHWLNLSHTWGDGDIGQPSGCQGSGDNVQDTPKTIGTADLSCNLSQNTCTNEVPDKVDNVQNYMDYSSCAKMFTIGQKNRMQAAANSNISGRKKIWSTSNLAFTGVDKAAVLCAPIADFKASTELICTGQNINLSDKSYNATVDNTWQWSWHLPGATPSSSNQQNVTVKYANPGKYKVTLTVTNSTGSSTLSRTDFIYVNTDQPVLSAPLEESFENASFPNASSDFNKNWHIEGPSNALIRTSASKTSGTYSLRYQNLNFPTATSVSLISPTIDFSDAKSPANLTFDLAYARRTNESSDKLEVYISTDCGKSWLRRYVKQGNSLATVSNNISPAFIPNASQWRTETVNIMSLIGVSKGMIKFTITDGDGNNIYLDNINILSVPLGNNEIENQSQWLIYPNPGENDAILEWGNITTSFDLTLTDIMGRVIGKKKIEPLQHGANNIRLSLLSGKPLERGTYIIYANDGVNTKFLKWVSQ